jgi:alkylation response protein AidB-like acyl-CoA dehydrogenase
VRNQDGSLNGITIARLKDKLGTKALPTAELDLKNTEAILLGEEERGAFPFWALAYSI